MFSTTAKVLKNWCPNFPTTFHFQSTEHYSEILTGTKLRSGRQKRQRCAYYRQFWFHQPSTMTLEIIQLSGNLKLLSINNLYNLLATLNFTRLITCTWYRYSKYQYCIFFYPDKYFRLFISSNCKMHLTYWHICLQCQ